MSIPELQELLDSLSPQAFSNKLKDSDFVSILKGYYPTAIDFWENEAVTKEEKAAAIRSIKYQIALGSDFERPCLHCGDPIYRMTKQQFNPNEDAESRFCSQDCSRVFYARDSETKKKRSKTLQDKYGVTSISQIDAVKEKKKQKSLEKYGVENVSQASEVKIKKIKSFKENHSGRGYEDNFKSLMSFEDLQKTLQDKSSKYLTHQLKAGNLKEDLSQFYKESMEKYSDENLSVLQKGAIVRNIYYLIIRGHRSNTECIYPECSNLIHTMYKKNKGKFAEYCSPSCIANHKLKSKDNWHKIKKTNLERYGHESPLGSSDVQQKVVQTNLSKYGVKSAASLRETTEKRIKTVNEKYGVSNVFQLKSVKEKSKNTLQKNYGVDHALQNPEKLKKSQNTLKENHGVSNPLSSPEIKRKQEDTLQKNHGVSNPLHSPEIKRKQEDTLQKNHEVSNPLKSSSIRDRVRRSRNTSSYEYSLENKILPADVTLLDEFEGIQKRDSSSSKLLDHTCYLKYNFKCNKCNREFKHDLGSIPLCPTCYAPKNLGSLEEDYWRKYLQDLSQEVTRTSFKAVTEGTQRHEIDLFLAEKKLGFEYNGVYWHSRRFKEEKYHQDKTIGAMSKGINLIHIWSTDDEIKVKNRIKSLLGMNTRVFARKTSVTEIDYETANEVIGSSHLHGMVKSTKYYGLIHNGECVSAIAFTRRKELWEITRFATKIGLNIVGGFSKLMKKFISSESPTQIMTYADRDWTPDHTQSVYFKYGFQYVEDTGPILWYTDNSKMFARQRFQKQNIEILFPDIYKDSMTADDMLALKGIYPVYNSGNHKFILTV
jgi:hypothetical protein